MARRFLPLMLAAMAAAAPAAAADDIIYCDAGGPGADSCSLHHFVPPFITTGCSVSCPDGENACCVLGGVFGNPSCTCIADPDLTEPDPREVG